MVIQFTGDCYNESVPKEKNRNLKNTFAENEMECMNHDENELEKEHALAECKKIREIYEPLYPQFFTRYFGTEQAEYKTEDAIGGGYASYQCLVDFLGGRADTIPGIVNWIEKTEKRLE